MQLRRLVCRHGGAKTERELAQVEDFWTLNLDAVKQLLLFFVHLVSWTGDQDSGVLRGDSLGGLGGCGFARRSPTRNKARHHGAFAPIAFLTDHLIKAGGVVAALI